MTTPQDQPLDAEAALTLLQGTPGQDPPPPPQPLPPSPTAATPAQPEQRPAEAPSGERLPVPSASPLPSQEPARTNDAVQPGEAAESDVGTQDIQFDPGGLVSLHTNELDVRQFLELISRRSGMNILISPRVSGTITANFEKVPVNDLLRSVLKLADLVEKVDGDIHFIYARDEVADQAETLKKERIVTKVYRLNYVRADEMMVMLTPFLSPDVGQKRFATSANYQFGISEASTLNTGSFGGGGIAAAAGGGAGGAGGVGGAGTIQRGTQPPTGGASMSGSDVLVIQDYESNLKIIDQIVLRLDVQPVQVLIEAVIISVELDTDKQLGVNFAVVDNLGQQLGTVGSGAAINSNTGFTPSQVLTAAGKIAAGAAIDPAGFASATNGIKYGFVSNNVTGFVRALETVGSTKVLASPRVLVLNKQRAEIQLGSRLGFRTLSQNYTSTIQQVQFLNVGTLLRIRPFVSTDGMVRMEIHPERSQGAVVDDLPSATTAELTTNVMVPNGATLVIGGLMEDEDQFQAQGLPGLTRMPLLGPLFGYKQKTDKRRELVVMLTPHIWSDGMSPEELVAQKTPHHTIEVERPATPEERADAALPLAGSPSPIPATVTAAPSPLSSSPPFGEFKLESAPGRASSRPETASTPRTTARSSPSAGARPRVASRPRPSTVVSPPPSPSHSEPKLLPIEAIELAGDRGLRDLTVRDSAQDRPASANLAAASAPRAVSSERPKVDPALRTTAMTTTSKPAKAAPAPVPVPTVQPEANRAKPPVRRHVVQNGDTFATIAKRYYGLDAPVVAKALWWYNRETVAWPEAIALGMKINVPPYEDLKPVPRMAQQRGTAKRDPAVRQAGLDVAATPASTRQNPAADRPNRTATGSVVHVVRQGETLRGIARDRLGDEHRAEEIAELNQEMLPVDSAIVAGMRLLLPADAQPLR